MDFLEKDLEQIIFENYFNLPKKGLELFDNYNDCSEMYRQVNLGAYGIADLIYVEIIENIKGVAEPNSLKRRINIYVIECKLKLIDINTYMQAKRYVTGLKKIYEDSLTRNTEVNFYTVLIGSKLQLNGDFVFVLNDDERCSAYTYSYGIDGINFEIEEGYFFKNSSPRSEDLKNQLLGLCKEYSDYIQHRSYSNKKQ